MVQKSIPWKLKDLSLFRKLFALFDDDVRAESPLGAGTAMENLCEASVYVASTQKPEGIRILLDNLCYIPERGYHCGCEGIVRILLTKKYFEKFRMSLADVTVDTGKLVKRILEGLTNPIVVKQRNELTDMLNQYLQSEDIRK